MVSREVDSESDAAAPITPMSEIRRYKGMRLEEYAELYPVWAEWMRNNDKLMYDADGRAWVARWNPELGLPIGGEDDEEFTPEVAEALAAEARQAREEILAGGGIDFRELDADESFWNDD